MNSIEIARTLFTLRKERDLTIEDLAQALNVTPETVCEWECAKTSPSLDQMNRLAKVYGIPLDEVIRNPKPREEAPTPIAIDPELTAIPEESPVSEEEPPVPEGEPEPLPEQPLRRKRNKKASGWDWLVIGLLLSVMAVALYLLLNPELLPLN